MIIRERLLWRRQLVDRYFTTYEMVSRNSSAECGRYVRRRSHQLLLPREAITAGNMDGRRLSFNCFDLRPPV